MKGGLNELALFSGAGGGLLASKLLGWNTIGAVEIEEYPRNVVLQRQRDGMLEPFPIWDDVCTFDGRPWRGSVDVVSGGFPCQDISSAGKGAGLAGDRSGLWFEYLRIVDEVRPRFVFAENSPNLRTRGLGTVIEGLVSLGYGVRWCVLGAWHVGAPHKRDRMWVLAKLEQAIPCYPHSDSESTQPVNDEASGLQGLVAHTPSQRPHHQANIEELEGAGQGELHTVQSGDSEDVAHTNSPRREEQRQPVTDEAQHQAAECGGWWETEPGLGRVANGVADRVDRLKAIGNGQVPAVAAIAWQTLSQGVA
jgi:DNA (cytosine-5)-methyltransferase 1